MENIKIDYETEYSNELSIKHINLGNQTHPLYQNHELTVQEAGELAQNAQMENDLSEHYSGLEGGWDE